MQRMQEKVNTMAYSMSIYLAGDHYYSLQGRSDEGLDLCLVITITVSKKGPMKDWICAW